MERGIPRSIKREQAPVDDEAIRSAITEQCIRHEPAASAACYSARDWELQFEQRWILQDERYMRTSTEIEGSGHAIYCRTCVEPRRHGKLAAFRLHVTIHNQDPMQVSKHGIIMLECHNCGFEQVVHRKPKVRGMQGVDANGVYIDEYSDLKQSGFEQMLKQREAQMRMGKSLLGQGMYDPRMAAQGIGGASLGNALRSNYAQELQSLRTAFENNQISQREFEEHARHIIEDANRRVNVANNPPMLGPVKPPV